MQKWEYVSILVDGPGLQAKLNELGLQGWEAVGFVAAQHTAEDSVSAGVGFMVSQWGTVQYRVLLKRPKP